MPSMPKFLLRLAVLLAAMLTLTGCGFDGSYRYKCQDPQNWKLAECNPPVCKASGTCTTDLLPDVEFDDKIQK
jgi:hypothetical protein